MKFLLYAIIIALPACTAPPKNAGQSVYAVESAYVAALTVAVKYKALPPCAPASTMLCSKPEVVAKIQKADDAAYPALQAAQKVVRQPDAGANAQTAIFAAEQAVSALTAITSTLGIQ